MGRELLVDAEQDVYHVTDLLFAGLAVAADRLLDLRGRILVNRDPDEGG
jgi:hypothetical protein